MQKKAILLDVRSIQRYIYAANKLRTNIGASFLVEQLFEDRLINVLDSEFQGEKDLETWKGKPEKENWQCQVKYIGGGNALVLFDDSIEHEVLRRIVAKFSQSLLVDVPGLHIGVAIGQLELSEPKAYKESLDALFKQLKQNQNNVIPTVNLPYTGFTQLCDIDGETANYYDAEYLFTGERHSYYSQEAVAKAQAVGASNAKLESMFQNVLKGTSGVEYCFPMELEELGQKKNKNNYIAIVHIDGNNMGVKFNKCKSLDERRVLSIDIREKTRHSFERLIESIVAEYEEYLVNGVLALKPENGKKLLPIRPLILGGDDVTFICPAVVALAYAKRFVKFMKEPTATIKIEAAKSIDCCGGIAILPTKYPFFRGYVLSEQLCDSAKTAMRKLWDEDNPSKTASSWLDFVFLHGEQAPSLEQILQQEYLGELGDMHFGPYWVFNALGQNKADDDHDIEKLIACAKQFKSCMQKNKVKELRSVLHKDRAMINSFMIQLRNLKQELPAVKYEHVDRGTGWGTGINGGVTPYIDAIEMMEYMEGADR